MKKVTDEEIKDALEASYGLITNAAKVIGYNRQSLHRRISSSAELTDFVSYMREPNLDLAESKLMDAVNEGEAWAISLYLKCIGQKRGYIDKQQVDMNATIENTGSVSIYLPSNGRDVKQITDETDSPA